MKSILLSSLAFIYFVAFGYGQTLRVLFIGNSYTAVNNLPQMIADIASSQGDTLIYDSNTPGGYTFQMHSTNTTTLNKIQSQNWDYVVLQAQSQEPAFPPAQVESQTYPYADTLVKRIMENDSCTRISFYMTWGRKNGDASNCPFYPVICTYEGMQYRLRASYLEMAQSNDQELSPVGVVWRTIRQTDTSINLYQPDESHPSVAGTYVAATTFYCSLFQKSFSSTVFEPVGLTSTQAQFIRQTAEAIVFDSLSLWGIDTLINFSGFYTLNDSAGYLHFIPDHLSNDSYNWIINGITYSTPEVYVPIETSYSIDFTTSRNCIIQSKADTLIMTSYFEVENNPIKIFPNPGSHQLVFSKPISGTIEFILPDGRIIACIELSESNTIQLEKIPSGLYKIRINHTNVLGTYVVQH